jgi:hypothetical protein
MAVIGNAFLRIVRISCCNLAGVPQTIGVECGSQKETRRPFDGVAAVFSSVVKITFIVLVRIQRLLNCRRHKNLALLLLLLLLLRCSSSAPPHSFADVSPSNVRDFQRVSQRAGIFERAEFGSHEFCIQVSRSFPDQHDDADETQGRRNVQL